VPVNDDRVTTQQWVLGRAAKSKDPQYNNLAMSSIYVEYDDDDVQIYAAAAKVLTDFEQVWTSSTGTLIIVIIACLALVVTGLVIIGLVQRQSFTNKIRDERQKNYEYRQRMLSDSSDHERSIVFRRSTKDERNDDGNGFDDISGAHVSESGAKSSSGADDTMVDVGDDLASMEVDYGALVKRLALQLNKLAQSNAELAEKHGISPVVGVQQAIQSGDPSTLFDKIREVKQANLAFSREEKAAAARKKKSKSRPSSIVPMDLSNKPPSLPGSGLNQI